MRKHLCVGPVHALKRRSSNLRGFHLSGRSLPYGPARAPTPRSMGVDKFLEHRAVDTASTASEREAAMLKAAAGSAQTLVVTVTTKPWADPYRHALRALRGAGGNPLFLSRSQEITLISTRSQKVPLRAQHRRARTLAGVAQNCRAGRPLGSCQLDLRCRENWPPDASTSAQVMST